MTSLRLLGSPSVERDGEPVAFDTRKALALASYLAVTGRQQRRDRLAGLLWPEYSQDRARAALRRTLSVLRREIGEEHLETDRETVGLVEEGIWIDVTEFERLLGEAETHDHEPGCEICVSGLRRAASLYRGDFLEGFALRDAAPFDDWVMLESDRLRRWLASGLDDLIDHLVAGGELTEAIDVAQRWLVLEPLHELAYRRLMQLHAWHGDRAAAIRLYLECVRTLENELGVKPLEETTALYDAIRRGVESPPLETRTLPGERDEPAVLLPLVGRESEWAELADLIGARGRVVVIEGEPGIGKTRLAAEFLAAVRAGALGSLWAAAHENEADIAYGPVADLLREATRSDGVREAPQAALAEAARLVPELSTARAEAAGPGAERRFFEGVSRTLEAAVGPGGWIGLDDLHWADDASLVLIAYLIRRLRDRSFNALVTWRTEEAPPGHPLRVLADELARREGSVHLRLSRLGREEVARLADASGLPEEAELLFDVTEGVPFFVSEYLAALRGGEPQPVPGGMRGLLRSRLSRVSELGSQLLAAAAVIGRPFELELLRVVSGRREDEALDGLDELLGRGLLREEGDLQYDFSHHQLRAAVLEETSLARRRVLHRRAATALSARSGTAAQVAHHLQEAGLDTDAAAAHRRAGEEALSVFANRRALGHFQAALALGDPDQTDLHLLIGDIETLLGDYGAARASYEMAAALAGDGSSDVEHRLGSLALRRQSWDLAEQHLRAAIGLSGSTGGDAWADLALALRGREALDQAAAAAQEALRRAEQSTDLSAMARAENILGILARARGETGPAIHHLQTSLARAEEAGDTAATLAALNNLALACGQADRPEEGLAHLERALVLCRLRGDRHREAAVHNNFADLARQMGRVEESMAHLKEAAALFAEVGADPGSLEPEIWQLTEW